MSEKVDIWMPMFVGDYLKDTGHLLSEEKGIYTDLLFQMWIHGGSLPAEERRLIQLARTDRDTWDRAWPTVRKFFQEADGRITQKRLAEELEEAKEQRASAAARAKKASSARWSSPSSNAPSIPQALLEDMLKQCPSPSPSPSPSPLQTQSKDPPLPPKGDVGPAYSDPFEKAWEDYPRKEGKGSAWRAWPKAAKSVGGEIALLNLVVAALPAQKRSEQWVKDNGQFIPHFATYLNQRRWEDEVPANGARASPAFGAQRPREHLGMRDEQIR